MQKVQFRNERTVATPFEHCVGRARARWSLYTGFESARRFRGIARPRLWPLTISRRNFAAVRERSSLSSFFSLSLFLSHLPRAIAYHFSQQKLPEKKRRRNWRNNRCATNAVVAWSPRVHAHRSCLSSFFLLAYMGPVSLDECGSSHAYKRETWTEFKPIQGRWTGDRSFPIPGHRGHFESR